MTVYITLNRQALTDLISNDPDFELDLKAAVISEVARRFFIKDANRVIAAANPELFAKVLEAVQTDVDMVQATNAALEGALAVRSADYYKRLSLNPQVQALITDYINRKKDEVIVSAAGDVGQVYREAIEKAVEAKLAPANLQELVDKRVEMTTNAEIKKLVDERVNQRMADLRSLIGNA